MSQPVPQRHVTIIMGSPRKNSNTHILAGEAVRGLTARGISTTMVFPDDLAIRDCRGCHACKQEPAGTCIIPDDMQALYPLIARSEGIIVAAPVYFGYVPAMTKAWLDRLVPFIGPGMSPGLSGTRAVSCIFVQNMPDPALFMPGLRSFINGIAMTGFVMQDCLVATDCEAGIKPMAAERPVLMERAYALGRDLLG